MGGVHSFFNKATQKKLLAFSTKTDGSDMNAIKGQAAWDALAKRPADINPLFMEEVLFCLEESIFGTNMIGRNAYQLLRRLMQNYKVDSNQGVKEWQCCINQLSGYIVHMYHVMLWKIAVHSRYVIPCFVQVEGLRNFSPYCCCNCFGCCHYLLSMCSRRLLSTILIDLLVCL